MKLLELLEDDAKDLVIIYPGRFHPFHIGHGKVYKYLKQKYSNAKVFIATSGKTDNEKSPFTFDEKRKMMMLAGVDSSAIVQTRSPYAAMEIVEMFDPDKTVVIYAISEKDMENEPRFDFSNGVSFKKNGEPAHMQKWEGMESADTVRKHSYIATTPTFPFKIRGAEINSASQIRNMISKSDDTELSQILQDLYNVADIPQDVLEIFKRKIGNSTMNENWNEDLSSAFLLETTPMKINELDRKLTPEKRERLEQLAAEIKSYVDDHKKHLDTYPMDVEVDDKVYDYDEYWEILDQVYPNPLDESTKQEIFEFWPALAAIAARTAVSTTAGRAAVRSAGRAALSSLSKRADDDDDEFDDEDDENQLNASANSSKEMQDEYKSNEDEAKHFDPKTARALMMLKTKYPQADNILSALLADVENKDKDSDTADLAHELEMKDLTKALDILQKEINILKGDKKYSFNEESVNEAFFLAPWILPAVATAIRVGGGAALKLLLKSGKKAAPKVLKTGGNLVQKSTGTGIIVGAVGKTLYDKVDDAYEGIKKWFKVDMDEDTLTILAQLVVKYGIPLGGIAAILYGGKQLKDYMSGEEEKGNTTINNYYYNNGDDKPVTEASLDASSEMQDEYKSNEDRNAHSRNIYMLAKVFGTPEEVGEIEKLLKVITKQGYKTPEQSQVMYDMIHTPYYSKLFPSVEEGYTVLPSMDREKYQERPGLEGPFTLRSGKVVYYDVAEGAYYDSDSDIYLSYEEYQAHDDIPHKKVNEAIGKLNKNGEIEMTKANYVKIHKDFKSKIDGTYMAMQIDPKTGGTALFPVKFIKELTDSVDHFSSIATEIAIKEGADRDSTEYKAGAFAAKHGKAYDSNPHKPGRDRLNWSMGHNEYRANKLRKAGKPNYGARGQFESK